MTLLREASREAWGWKRLEALARDVRYGLRLFGRSPGFTAATVLTLALGLGANTAIFTVLYSVLLRPLPYPDPGGIAKVYLTVNEQQGRGERTIGFSYPKFEELRRTNTVFASMAGYALRYAILTAPAPADRISGEFVSAAYFRILGVPAALGRTFLDGEDATPGRHAVAVIGDGLWRDRFGGDRQNDSPRRCFFHHRRRGTQGIQRRFGACGSVGAHGDGRPGQRDESTTALVRGRRASQARCDAGASVGRSAGCHARPGARPAERRSGRGLGCRCHAAGGKQARPGAGARPRHSVCGGGVRAADRVRQTWPT